MLLINYFIRLLLLTLILKNCVLHLLTIKFIHFVYLFLYLQTGYRILNNEIHEFKSSDNCALIYFELLIYGNKIYPINMLIRRY